MPLDVLGRTRATLTGSTSSSPWPKGLGNLVKPCRAGDRALQLLLFNEEFLVGASHQLVPITSLPFICFLLCCSDIWLPVAPDGGRLGGCRGRLRLQQGRF